MKLWYVAFAVEALKSPGKKQFTCRAVVMAGSENQVREELETVRVNNDWTTIRVISANRVEGNVSVIG